MKNVFFFIFPSHKPNLCFFVSIDIGKDNYIEKCRDYSGKSIIHVDLDGEMDDQDIININRAIDPGRGITNADGNGDINNSDTGTANAAEDLGIGRADTD